MAHPIFGVRDLVLCITDHLELADIQSLLRTSPTLHQTIKLVEPHLCRVQLARFTQDFGGELLQKDNNLTFTTIRGLDRVYKLYFAVLVSWVSDNSGGIATTSYAGRLPPNTKVCSHMCDVPGDMAGKLSRALNWQARLAEMSIPDAPRCTEMEWRFHDLVVLPLKASGLLRRLCRIASRVPARFNHSDRYLGEGWVRNPKFVGGEGRRDARFDNRLYSATVHAFRKWDADLAALVQPTAEYVKYNICEFGDLPTMLVEKPDPKDLAADCTDGRPCAGCEYNRQYFILQARLAILRKTPADVIRATYRLRILQSVSSHEDPVTGATIDPCTCSPWSANKVWPFNTVWRGCPCTSWRWGMYDWNRRDHDPPTHAWQYLMGKRASSSSCDRLCGCGKTTFPHAPKRHPACEANATAAATAPRAFDLFDPWTLWWFLDGEDAAHGVDLLFGTWSLREQARMRRAAHADPAARQDVPADAKNAVGSSVLDLSAAMQPVSLPVRPSTLTSTKAGTAAPTLPTPAIKPCPSSPQGKSAPEPKLYWRERSTGRTGPATRAAVRDGHVLCPLVLRCHEAWLAAEPTRFSCRSSPGTAGSGADAGKGAGGAAERERKKRTRALWADMGEELTQAMALGNWALGRDGDGALWTRSYPL